MENEYYCPHCRAALKVNEQIILTAKVDDKKGGLILFEPQLGDYKIIKHKECQYDNNKHVEFLCPVCHKNLSAEHENLAEILLIDDQGDEYEIWFSEIVGEHATYKIKAGKVFNAYGEDQSKYMNFFGKSPEY
jgi:uncharacterized protein YbaR (Trm112 family)